MSEQGEKAEGTPVNSNNNEEVPPPPLRSEAATPSQSTSVVAEPLQDLHTPHRRRRLILVVGILLATMDLCCLPITYAQKTFPSCGLAFSGLTVAYSQVLLRF